MVIGGKEFVIDYLYPDNYPSLKIDIIISSLDSTPKSIKLERALIDTGSDYTLIPIDTITKLGLKYNQTELSIEGFNDGNKPEEEKEKVRFYFSKVSIEGIIDVIMPIGGINSDPIIGMDLIKKLHILINCPLGTFEIANNKNYKKPRRKPPIS